MHLNGYVKTDTGGYKLWIARRSPMKATYPGMLDNMVVHRNHRIFLILDGDRHCVGCWGH